MTESPGESVRSMRRDNRGAPPLVMAEPATRKAQKNRLDPLTAAAVVFFLLAVIGYNPQRGMLRRAPQPA